LTSVRVFHTTYAAKTILSEGFRDATGKYMTPDEYTGVWVADRPVDVNEGASGNVVLCLDVPEVVLAKYEWIEDRKGYREFLVPAEALNRFGPPQVHQEWPEDFDAALEFPSVTPCDCGAR
jgi:hypothetical protein